MSKRASDVGRIGGSWIAAAVGLSEYRSPLDAYQRIVGEVEDQLEGEAIDRGNFLEPALRQWHKKKIAAHDIIQLGTQQHREHRWATYTPDGMIITANHVEPAVGLAEYKSPGDEVALKYGEPGTDQVPRDVGVQVHWGLFVTDLPRADVAALIGGELRLFHVKRDPELEREVFDKASHFMRTYVDKKRPPPATYSDRDTEWVSKRWPKSDGRKLAWGELTAEQRKLVERYIVVYRAAKDLKQQQQELENLVKSEVFQSSEEIISLEGDAGAPFKRVSWKNNAQGNPKWKEIAEKLHALLLQPNPPHIRSLEEMTGDKGNRSEAPRVFRPWFRRGDDE